MPSESDLAETALHPVIQAVSTEELDIIHSVSEQRTCLNRDPFAARGAGRSMTYGFVHVHVGLTESRQDPAELLQLLRRARGWKVHLDQPGQTFANITVIML